jgi:hypothetical protein
MNREGAVGLLLIGLLLGGLFLFSRRSAVSSCATYSPEYQSQGNIRLVSSAEPPHYRNKETRHIEYNADGLPTLIEITRDYTVA